MRFTVGIVGADGSNPHWRCFEDFARALASALRALGHEVVPATDAKPGRLIVFGGNQLRDHDRKLPEDAILFNPEQVACSVGDYLLQNRELWKSRVVWDYSIANVARLHELGFSKLVHCPIGYLPSMTTIRPNEDQDIDALFYGSTNTKRRMILDALDQTKLRVVRLFGQYGAVRDSIIARSKIVINLHFYDRPVFEIFRVSHLLANKKAVVSEDGGIDPDLEFLARRTTALVSRDRFVAKCVELVEDDEQREALEETGYREFKKLDFLETVRQAVAKTEKLS